MALDAHESSLWLEPLSNPAAQLVGGGNSDVTSLAAHLDNSARSTNRHKLPASQPLATGGDYWEKVKQICDKYDHTGGAFAPSWFQSIKDAMGPIMPPLLQSHHQPSTTTLSQLLPITLRELHKEMIHCGNVIYLRIQHVTIHNGMTISVRDVNGTHGLVWSLIAWPLPGGESSMLPGSIIAVKEPSYVPSINGDLAICVHHPTNIEHVSRFETRAKRLVSKLPPDFNLEKAEREASAAGRYQEAIDMCDQGLRVADTVSGAQEAWLLRRATAYARLHLYDEVLEDVNEIFSTNPGNLRALRLMCTASLDREDYEIASMASAMLLDAAPSRTAYQELVAKVATRSAQAEGHCDLGLLARATTPLQMTHHVADFVGNIEMRGSPLHGYGWFAKEDLKRGQIILWERAITVACDEKISSFENGLDGVFGFTDPSDPCGRSPMAYLQKLATTVSGRPRLHKKFFDCFDGQDSMIDSNVDSSSTPVFDTYRAMRTIRCNYHSIVRGLASLSLDYYDPNTRGIRPKAYAILPNMASNDLVARGLWPRITMFNHSCFPNVTHHHIGNIKVATVIRDVTKGEELLAEGVERGQPYNIRREALSMRRIECSCHLCTIERALTVAQRADREALYKAAEDMLKYPQHWGTRQAEMTGFQKTIHVAMKTYTTEMDNRLPCPALLEPLFRLGHALLGPVTQWSAVSDADLASGRGYFLLALMLGLRLYVTDTAPAPACMLKYGQYSLCHFYGILALMALAEIAYISAPNPSEWQRAAYLVRCAKMEYKLQYGEDATFTDHFELYNCMTLVGKVDELPVEGVSVRATEEEELRATNRA